MKYFRIYLCFLALISSTPLAFGQLNSNPSINEENQISEGIDETTTELIPSELERNIDKLSNNIFKISKSIDSTTKIHLGKLHTYIPLIFGVIGVLLGAFLSRCISNKQIEHTSKLLADQLGHTEWMEKEKRRREIAKTIHEHNVLQEALLKSISIFPKIIELRLDTFVKSIEKTKRFLDDALDEDGIISIQEPFCLNKAICEIDSMKPPAKLSGLVENVHQYGNIKNDLFSKYFANLLLYNHLCDLVEVQKDLIKMSLKEIDPMVSGAAGEVFQVLNSMYALAMTLKQESGELAKVKT